MTEDKALVERVRQYDIPVCNQVAARIEQLTAEVERLREAVALKDQYFKGITKLAALGEQ